MKTRLLTLLYLSCVSSVSLSFTGEPVAGGQSGFDSSIKAIEPDNQKLSLSLAGKQPVDISRFVLAQNQGASGARISPNGNTIAFAWSITGHRQVWLMPASGGQPRQLTFGNGVSNYRWSPDGQSLFYSADNNGNEQEAYYQISVDGQHEVELLPAAEGGFRVFGDFVDKHTIAYASTERNQLDFDIYTADLKTQSTTLLYEGNYGFFVSSASPDGRYLVVRETVGEDSDNLYLFDRQKQTMEAISKPERRANHSQAGISWTPDSKGFYLASNLNRNFAALMHYSLNDGFTLEHASSHDVERVRLCGDKGNYLIWSENKGGYSHLSGQYRLSGKQVKMPDLPEGVYSLHCNQGSNHAVITLHNYRTAGDIYLWEMDTGAVDKVFTANLAGLDPDTLVRPESITMTARDGVTLQGLLYLPKGKSENKPAVLFRVHGGPTSQSRPYFNATAQYLLGKGIAVFLPNVRGSTGFGHNYVTLDDRENRLHSIRDLVDMLAYLKKDGRVDTDNAAVAGGSYGGYAVNAVLANYPGHFKAGVSLFGVADWVTALQVASPALKASDRIEYGDITEQRWLDFYTQHSPIRQANKINVPVLYSHGVMDPRIDIHETEVMVKTLRENGIDAPFIRIPDEGHGWRKLANQLFYYREEAKFLEEQLNNN